jgi:predicted RNA-binding Zn-ribbon protein involved in translation (DUF1610 family)
VPIRVSCPSCQRAFNAPDNAAGKRAKCPTCGGPIEIPGASAQAAPPAPPKPIAPLAPPAHEDIFKSAADPVSAFADADFDDDFPAMKSPSDGDRKPCPMCGEQIQKDAVKCRYCGEIFDPVLRAQAKKRAIKESPGEDLSTGDWVIAIICSNIGCILGIVWMIQGKPKGKKMFLVALCMQFVWGAVGVVLELLSTQ